MNPKIGPYAYQSHQISAECRAPGGVATGGNQTPIYNAEWYFKIDGRSEVRIREYRTDDTEQRIKAALEEWAASHLRPASPSD